MGPRRASVRDACGVSQGTCCSHQTMSKCWCALHRYPPFFDEHHYKIYEKILEARVDFPKFVNVEKPAM